MVCEIIGGLNLTSIVGSKPLTSVQRNARRCFKKSVTTLIATSRLMKGGLAARERANSLQKEKVSEDLTGDDWEDGVHTDCDVDVEIKKRLSLELVLEEGVTHLIM